MARAVPAGDRLWFRLVCRSWAAAGAGAAGVPGEEPLPPGKLTRTRGPDVAASAARAEMVLAVLERSPLRVKRSEKSIFYYPDPDRTYTSEVFKNIICPSAAEGGHLEVLQWARAKGYPWDLWTCANAASNGHLEVLQWSVANGCMGDEEDWPYILDNAAKNGHLKVLQWARAHGCPWDDRTCRFAAKNGHLKVLHWARAHGCP